MSGIDELALMEGYVLHARARICSVGAGVVVIGSTATAVQQEARNPTEAQATHRQAAMDYSKQAIP